MIPWLDDWHIKILNYLSKLGNDAGERIPFSHTTGSITVGIGYPYVEHVYKYTRNLGACGLLITRKGFVTSWPKEHPPIAPQQMKQLGHWITPEGRTLVEAYRKVWPKELGVLP
jgi:hypothetical protein